MLNMPYPVAIMEMNPFTGVATQVFIANDFSKIDCSGRKYILSNEGNYCGTDTLNIPLNELKMGFDYLYHGNLDDVLNTNLIRQNDVGRA